MGGEKKLYFDEANSDAKRYIWMKVASKQREVDESIINRYKMTHEVLQHQIVSVGKLFS